MHLQALVLVVLRQEAELLAVKRPRQSEGVYPRKCPSFIAIGRFGQQISKGGHFSWDALVCIINTQNKTSSPLSRLSARRLALDRGFQLCARRVTGNYSNKQFVPKNNLLSCFVFFLYKLFSFPSLDSALELWLLIDGYCYT